MPDQWEVEDAARTLVRAEEIKQNQTLYNQVQQKLREQADAMNKAANKSKSDDSQMTDGGVSNPNLGGKKVLWSPAKQLGKIGGNNA